MKGLILVLVLLVAGFVGLGFYMGWFQLSSNSGDNKASITLSVDNNKIQQDKGKAVNKVQEMGQRAKE